MAITVQYYQASRMHTDVYEDATDISVQESGTLLVGYGSTTYAAYPADKWFNAFDPDKKK